MPMPLYPTTILDYEAALGYVPVDDRSLVVIPITVAATSVNNFALTHVAPVQDWSLQAWISAKPFSMSVEGCGPAAYWELQRISPQILCLYTSDVIPLAGSHSVCVLPGTYFLNVLNLVNEPNLFQFASV